MVLDIITFIQTQFINRLDYNLSFIAITLLFSFYGSAMIKWIVRKMPGSKAKKFIIFLVIVLFGVNLLMVFLVNSILSISNVWFKWFMIAILVFWSFMKFDSVVLREPKDKRR
jgi:hypothetical protein